MMPSIGTAPMTVERTIRQRLDDIFASLTGTLSGLDSSLVSLRGSRPLEVEKQPKSDSIFDRLSDLDKLANQLRERSDELGTAI